MTDLEIENLTSAAHERIRAHLHVTAGHEPPRWHELAQEEQLTLMTLAYQARTDRDIPPVILWADLRIFTATDWLPRLPWLNSELGPLRDRSVFTLYVTEARG